MSRRPRDLDVAELAALPSDCRSCVFWETSTGARGPARDGGAAEAGKQAWWRATELDWGPPVKGIVVDDRLVAYATVAPAEDVPRAKRLGPRVSGDAALLATLWVAPEWRGGGFGRALVQAVLREGHRRGATAVEAFGARGDAAAPCVVPEAFLRAVGFSLHCDHRQHPLLRLDIRQTVSWEAAVRQVLDGVRSAIGGRDTAPAPSSARAVRHRTSVAEH